MPTSSAIASVGAGLRIKLGTHEVFAACATMTGAAKDAYVVNKIIFLHLLVKIG